jgi:transposase-like protein
MVGPVVVTTTAPQEKTTMTKIQDRTVVKVAKEALWTDREGLKELFRGVLQEVLEAEMTEAIGALKNERTEGRLATGLALTREGS